MARYYLIVTICCAVTLAVYPICGNELTEDRQRKLNPKAFEPRHEKTGFCICENKDADQIRGNREADQRLSFRYMYSAIPLLSKSELSSF